MSSAEVELRGVWHRSFGATRTDLLDGLLARLREPHRRYHTAVHVVWVLRHLQRLVDAERGRDGGADAAIDDDALRLAALYHDAVYDPTRADNEAVSAKLAVTVAAELGWDAARCHEVHQLVMATATHQPASTPQALLVDADLAVLGASPADYTAYMTGVRAEYAHVNADEWRLGRVAVLDSFLDSPTVFHTTLMQHEREARARANMSAERAALLR